MSLIKYLQVLAKHDGSDLYLSTGAVPSAKFQGTLKQLGKEPLKSGQIAKMIESVMDEDQKVEFEEELELNMAVSIPSGGRFRLNMFKQRNEVSVVARNIVAEIPEFEKLGLPEVLKEVVMAKRGLILFVGGTGSGKSTSLASLIDHRNRHSAGHIITIEDPIEFVHKHRKSIINQREVGVDTKSFHAALKNTLRQAPDVILIGEIRDRETMEHALAFAETGHLAISTLHANNANQALDRIVNFFPEERRPQLLQDLGLNMQAIISQRLIPTVDKKRVAAVEVLLGNTTIQDLVMKGDTSGIKEIMAKSENLGMQTFDAALFKLHKAGKITMNEALKNADSENNLRLRIKLDSGEGANEKNAGGFSLENDHDEQTEQELQSA
ncbi:PilT/PilU family type 4a pilus ATPase [Bermanella marisrubri]|uniref:Tfp pilus assembly protein, ATPase PilU n=1 Tax=Bermanella marisrubri TaxID=207949 RepID=Q1N4I1_9GAMM|nr:PilT/PilU family type 4a pilus ATPase [Bermanella marisrubri]EAT13447.1 Tfp pilus assembly protein, ATPase PilU [Oceanobacter sp. RED65] [Bermanella marisrubri]QIZ84194.1 PilT/PilU family type 4a pilus ATPase [Bermanella marisrubri]